MLLLRRHPIAHHRGLLTLHRLLLLALHGLSVHVRGLAHLRLAVHLRLLTLHRLLAILLHLRLLAIGLRLAVTHSRLLAITLRHAVLAVSLGLAGLLLTVALRRHAVLTVGLRLLGLGLAWLLLCWLLGLSLRLGRCRLGGLRSCNLLHQFVLLQITAELVIIDALLQANEDVVELDVELSALLDKDRQVLSNNDGLVDGLEELVLGRIVSHSSQQLVQLRGVLLDHHRNLLLLGLKCLVLCEVLRVLGLIAIKNFLLSDCALIDLHELLNGIELIVHGDTIVHDLLLAFADRL